MSALSDANIYQIHGAMIGARLAFIEQLGQPSLKETICKSLTIAERQKLKQPLYEHCWFDLFTLESIDQAIIEALTPDQDREALLYQLGRSCAEYTYSRLPERWSQQAPEELLKQSAHIKNLWQNFGKIEFQSLYAEGATKRVRLQYQHPSNIGCDYCVNLMGYLTGLLDLLGHKVLYLQEIKTKLKPISNSHTYEICWHVSSVAQILPNKGIELVKQPVAKVKTSLIPQYSPSTLPTYSPKPYKRKTTRAWRIDRLVVLALIIMLISLFSSLSYGAIDTTKTKSEKLAYYKCQGQLKCHIVIDMPYLLVKSEDNLTNVKWMITAVNQPYHTTTPQLVAQMLTEIPLKEFTEPTTKHALPPDSSISQISLSAQVQGQIQHCQCVVEH